MNEPEFGDRAAERMWKSEGLFAEAKVNHCLARAKYRGRVKVQIQAYLSAIVQNLKRLLFPLYYWLFTCLHQQTRRAKHACSPTRQN
jgi:hypothetical protein